MIKVAVVILNWNGQKFLEKFLPEVVKHSATFASVFVADNASTDDSVFFLKKNFPEVKVIENSENGGFAKGYNDALSQIEAEYYVLLNSDIEVSKNWIQPVIELLDSDQMIAACQPKICSFQEPSKYEYAVHRVVTSTNLVIRFAVAGFFNQSKKTKGNTMILLKYFGQQELVCL